MNSNGILHITVNAIGRVRTWDTPGDAVSKKDADEVVLQISLTRQQIGLVLRAEQLAREKMRERQTRTSHNGYISDSTKGY